MQWQDMVLIAVVLLNIENIRLARKRTKIQEEHHEYRRRKYGDPDGE
jgi:hypothetical protein